MQILQDLEPMCKTFPGGDKTLTRLLILDRESMMDQSVNCTEVLLGELEFDGFTNRRMGVGSYRIRETQMHLHNLRAPQHGSCLSKAATLESPAWCSDNRLEGHLWGTGWTASPSPPDSYCFLTLDRGLLDSC